MLKAGYTHQLRAASSQWKSVRRSDRATEIVGDIATATWSTVRKGDESRSLMTHFGLSRMPFAKSIVAADHFRARPTLKPWPALASASSEGLLGVLVGDVGCGKTIAVRAAVDGVDCTRFR